MKKNRSSLSATIAGIALMGLGLNPTPVVASEPDTPGVWVKCYGVSKAGYNDCASLDGAHGCAGASKTDGDANEYIWLPRGTCRKLVNGLPYGERITIKESTQCLQSKNKKNKK